VQNFSNNEAIRRLSCRLTTGLLTASSCFRVRGPIGQGTSCRRAAGQIVVGMEHDYFIGCGHYLRLQLRLENVSDRIELLLAAPVRIVDYRFYYRIHPRQAPFWEQYLYLGRCVVSGAMRSNSSLFFLAVHLRPTRAYRDDELQCLILNETKDCLLVSALYNLSVRRRWPVAFERDLDHNFIAPDVARSRRMSGFLIRGALYWSFGSRLDATLTACSCPTMKRYAHPARDI
jgi:hypothetical protein